MHRRAFYCSANAIFGNVGRVASEEVVLQLINTKCMPSLLYVLEACPLAKSELSSLDFVVNRFFMKMFRTSNIEIVRNCQSYFGLSCQVSCGQFVLKSLMLNMPPVASAL